MTTVPTSSPASETLSPLLVAYDAARHVDPYPTYRAIREADPLARYDTEEGAVTLVTRHRDAVALLQDPAFGHGHKEKISPFRPDGDADLGLGSLLRADPPDHTRLRRLVSRAFTPGAITALGTGITSFVTTLLDTALADGEVDAIEALARPMPLRVICHLLGVPAADEALFGEWSRALVRGLDPDFFLTPDERAARNRAAREMDGYFRDLVARVRTRPGTDLVSQLVVAHVDEDRLTEGELLQFAALLLVAGYETTVNLISGGILALIHHPDQAALLRADPSLIPAAVEEMLRYEPPVQFNARTALRDTEISGQVFQRGDGGVTLVGSANRDPEVFDDPDRFLVTRYAGPDPAARHFGFGLGIHFCLGAPLARLEAEITFRLLLQHTTEITLTGSAPEHRDQSTIRGLRTLPVRLDA
jgi:cytochrome P450